MKQVHAPATRIFDIEDFRNWALADAHKAPNTVKEYLRRIPYLEALGFNPQLFMQSPESATAEARLVRAKLAGKPWQFLNATKVLNWLRLYAATFDDRFEDLKKFQARLPRSGRRPLLTDAELQVVLAYGQDVHKHTRYRLAVRRRRALLHLCAATGLRRSEIMRIRLSDFDFERQALRVAQPAKNGEPRYIPLPPALLRESTSPLLAWLRARPKCKTDALWVCKSDRRTYCSTAHRKAAWDASHGRGLPLECAKCEAVTPSSQWEAMTADGLSREMDTITAELGIRVGFNRFRHKRYVTWDREGVRPVVIKAIAGHSRITSTFHYLDHVEFEEMKAELQSPRGRRRGVGT